MPSPGTWNERYSRGEEAGADPDLVVIQAAGLVNAGFALDVACGKGRNALYLARSGFRVLALDYSNVAIAALQGRHPNLEARLEDLESTRLPDATFDLVCNARYLQRSLFAQIRRALKPGGVFAATIAVADSDPTVKPMNPAFLIEPGELAREFHGFDILLDEFRKVTGHRRMNDFIARIRTGNAQ